MYKMIMVATDGSGFDREAIRVALRVAERSRAKVQLVRVHSTGAFFGMGSSPDAATFSVEVLQQERDRILSELYALAAEYRNTSDAEIDVALEDGPVPDALQAYAISGPFSILLLSARHLRRKMTGAVSKTDERQGIRGGHWIVADVGHQRDVLERSGSGSGYRIETRIRRAPGGTASARRP